MRPESVLIIGEDSPGSLYRSYRKGFETLGVEVTGYCPVQSLERATPATRYRVARRLLHRVAARRLNDRIRDELSGARPDLILVLKGAEFAAWTIQHLRSVSGAPVVNFYPDDPFPDVRSNRLTFGPEVLASYDVCFTFARHLIPEYHKIGARTVQYLPFARDPSMHAPAPDAERPEFDLVFVGNLDEERVRWAEAVADRNLVVFGERTRAVLGRKSPLANATFRPAVYGRDFARAIRAGAIALNIMRVQNAGSHNMRSYESPACAAFTMSQRTPELVQLFREDEEIVCFGSRDELREKVDHWLSRPSSEREAVAQAGYRRVADDTYATRAKTIIAASLPVRAT